MAKQNVFNFKTMQFELVECYDLLSLIDDLNAECAAQQGLHTDAAIVPPAEHVQNSDIVPAVESDTHPRR